MSGAKLAKAVEKMRIAICPGSFDPITLGHLNIIRRASFIFEKVIVCIMVNSDKRPMFTLDERVELVKRVVERLKNVEVESSDKMIANYAAEKGSSVIVKGLRAVSDFEKEFQMALINRKMNPNLDTIFLSAGEKYTYLSSSVVKEMAAYGADISEFVPREIIEDIIERSKKLSGR